jgi:hypothetical protein
MWMLSTSPKVNCPAERIYGIQNREQNNERAGKIDLSTV